MKKILIGFLFISFQIAYCQQEMQNKMFSAPLPPNATALYKVLEKPLGNYTGTVPISFPLLSIKNRSLMEQITLNYNSTGGIKVSEKASSVGLGFSLVAGGSITQVVNDKPDNILGDYPLKRKSFDPTDPEKLKLFELDSRISNSNIIDTSPDIFYFSFGSESGKFFIDENDKAVIFMQKSLLNIEPIFDGGNRISKWIITDENGVKYYFGKNKNNSVNAVVENWSQFTSTGMNDKYSKQISSFTWYLTEKYNANGEYKVTYEYSDFIGNSQQSELSNAQKQVRLLQGPCDPRYFPNSKSDKVTHVVTDNKEMFLSKIITDNGYVIFNYDQDRKDLETTFKTKNIQLYNNQGKLIRNYRFNYDYFGDEIKYLKLLGFSEILKNKPEKQFKFDYYEDYAINTITDYKYSRDSWGFFNGKNNKTIFPNVIINDPTEPNGSGVIRLGNLADRNPDPKFAQTNLIKKITYPTGATRQFIYEGNTALTEFDKNRYALSPDIVQNKRFNDKSIDRSIISFKFFEINSTDGNTKFRFERLLENSYENQNCNGLTIRLAKVTNYNQKKRG